MNRSMLTLIVIASLLQWPPLMADAGDGGAAGAFLRIGAGVRALGMGNAHVSIADDVSAAYWNPAGLGNEASSEGRKVTGRRSTRKRRGYSRGRSRSRRSRRPATETVKRAEIMGSYTALSLDRRSWFGGAAVALPRGKAALYTVGFGVGKIDGRDAFGNPTGEFSDTEMALGLAYGAAVYPGVLIGLGGKYINHSLADNGAHGFGFDIGTQIRVIGPVSLGAVVQNIGGSLRWDTKSNREETIPVTFRCGLSGKAQVANSLCLVAAVDLEKTRDQDEVKWHAGGEAWYDNRFALRMGYDVDDLTAGASVKLSNLMLTYALSTDEIIDEGLVHQMGIDFWW